MEALTGINLYGWALIASLALGLVVALTSLAPGLEGRRVRGVALMQLLAGAAAIAVVSIFHWDVIIRLPALVLASSAAVFVALSIVLLSVIVVDFGIRRVVPAAVLVLGLIGVPAAARRDAVFAVLSPLLIGGLLFGLSGVSSPVGGAPSSSPIAQATPTMAPPLPPPNLSLTLVASGFDQPVFLAHAGDARIYVVERPGRIRILEPSDGGYTVGATFLDITSLTEDAFGEQGLLGLAFHPSYAATGLFYVVYTDNDLNVILAEFRRSSADRADPSSRRQLLKIRQFDSGHNGGWIGFQDGYLYMATGDGQGHVPGDPYDVGQATSTLLGKILRIDPLDPDGAGPRAYSIPATNPQGLQRPEIWAWGLRNPWRNSFDRSTGDMWITDVGDGLYEEVNRVHGGGGYNFGWRALEGRHLRSSYDLCSVDCHTLPIIEYRHGDDGCAIVGGYVSRREGSSIGGSYLYGDFCSGRIWAVPSTVAYGDSIPAPVQTEFGGTLSSFGEDVDGRIYVVTLAGDIWLIDQS